MIPVKPIDPEDLPLYAMQLLSPEEMEELTSQLQHSVEARRVLAEIYGDLAIFAQSAEMHDPPALAKQRLMKHVAKEKKPVPINPLDRYIPQPIDTYAPRATTASLLDDEPPSKTLGEKVTPWVGWLLAACLAGFAVMLLQQNGELRSNVATATAKESKSQAEAKLASQLMDTMKDPSAVHATLVGLAVKPQPSGRVTYVVDKGSLVFIASNLAPLQPEKTYELWVIPADGRAPMPAGTFKPDEHGNASVVLPELAAGVPAKAFGVTIELGEGSTVPTAPIILSGFPS